MWGLPVLMLTCLTVGQGVEFLSFTTAMLSGLAAGIHLVSIQILVHDAHVPSCAPGDRGCADSYNMIVVM